MGLATQAASEDPEKRKESLEQCPWLREQHLQRPPYEKQLCSRNRKEDDVARRNERGRWCEMKLIR